MIEKSTNVEITTEALPFAKLAVRRSLFDLSVEEKYKYLREKVYENIRHSPTGKLLISTTYCRKVAELLGGDYNSLNKIQKGIFKGDIVFECINVEGGFTKYTAW